MSRKFYCQKERRERFNSELSWFGYGTFESSFRIKPQVAPNYQESIYKCNKNIESPGTNVSQKLN